MKCIKNIIENRMCDNADMKYDKLSMELMKMVISRLPHLIDVYMELLGVNDWEMHSLALDYFQASKYLKALRRLLAPEAANN